MKKWKPKVNGKYWAFYAGFYSISAYKMTNANLERDKIHLYFGNCFRTKKEAEAVLRKIKRGGNNE